MFRFFNNHYIVTFKYSKITSTGMDLLDFYRRTRNILYFLGAAAIGLA